MVLYTRNGYEFFDDQLLSHMLNKNCDVVQTILENVDVKSLVESSGMTLLHHAVKANDPKTVKYLIERGCEVDALDACGNTPLLIAMDIYRRDSLTNMRRDIGYFYIPLDMKIIEALIEADAGILLQGQGNINSLQMALLLQHYCRGDITTTIFKALKRKYSTDQRQMAEILLGIQCSLPQAMLAMDSVVTEYMLNASCNIDERDPYNEFTALHYAVQNTDVNSAKLLIQRGADIISTNKDGHTSSYYYCPGKEESYDMLMIILKHDTTLNALNMAHSELARKVLEMGQLNEVEELLTRYNFDFEDTTWNSYGDTLLHSIATNKNPGVIQLLEGRRLDVHAKDRVYEGTALSVAVYNININCMELLLKHGANPNEICEEQLDGELYTIFSYGIDGWLSGDMGITVEECVKCVELFLEYDAHIFSENEEVNTVFDSYSNFNFYSEDDRFLIYQPIIARLAMMDAMGVHIRKNIFDMLENKKHLKKYFNVCKCKIRKIQEMRVNDTVTLFQFLTEPEAKLLTAARNDDSAERLEQIFLKECHSDIFFIKLLCKRIKRILEITKLRKDAASIISKVSGCTNQDVIEIIVLLLDEKSLQNLCEV